MHTESGGEMSTWITETVIVICYYEFWNYSLKNTTVQLLSERGS